MSALDELIVDLLKESGGDPPAMPSFHKQVIAAKSNLESLYHDLAKFAGDTERLMKAVNADSVQGAVGNAAKLRAALKKCYDAINRTTLDWDSATEDAWVSARAALFEENGVVLSGGKTESQKLDNLARSDEDMNPKNGDK